MVHKVILAGAAELDLPRDAEISVAFVSDGEIKELNRQFRGIDSPTDVLSFAFTEDAEPGEVFINASDTLMLGDIVISLERAYAQAVEYGHSQEREVGFLTAHGLLHLAGYDHSTREERELMENLQEKILQSLNLVR